MIAFLFSVLMIFLPSNFSTSVQPTAGNIITNKSGKGIATNYKPEKFVHRQDVNNPFFQITKLSSSDIDVVSIYRSQGSDTRLLADSLLGLIDLEKTVVICGDINICYLESRNNIIIQTLESLGFEERAQQATHIKGGHIDHVYFRSSKSGYRMDITVT